MVQEFIVQGSRRRRIARNPPKVHHGYENIYDIYGPSLIVKLISMDIHHIYIMVYVLQYVEREIFHGMRYQGSPSWPMMAIGLLKTDSTLNSCQAAKRRQVELRWMKTLGPFFR
jgi:hypothetical protein